jgi:hypothetical protein
MKGLVDHLRGMYMPYFHRVHTDGAVALPSPHDLGRRVEAGMNKDADGVDVAKKKRGGIGRLGKLALVGLGCIGLGGLGSCALNEAGRRADFTMNHLYSLSGDFVERIGNAEILPGRVASFKLVKFLQHFTEDQKVLNIAYNLLSDPVKQGNLVWFQANFMPEDYSQENLPQKVTVFVNGVNVWDLPSLTTLENYEKRTRFYFKPPILKIDADVYSNIGESKGVKGLAFYLDTCELKPGTNVAEIYFVNRNGKDGKYVRRFEVTPGPLTSEETRIRDAWMRGVGRVLMNGFNTSKERGNSGIRSLKEKSV